jgi:hypothetical protein
VFEGMRAVLSGGEIPWGSLQAAFLLNLVWGSIAATFFALNLRHVRKTGLLVKVATQ